MMLMLIDFIPSNSEYKVSHNLWQFIGFKFEITKYFPKTDCKNAELLDEIFELVCDDGDFECAKILLEDLGDIGRRISRQNSNALWYSCKHSIALFELLIRHGFREFVNTFTR